MEKMRLLNGQNAHVHLHMDNSSSSFFFSSPGHCLFFCLTRHDFFFWGHDFYFLINWVIAFFFFFWVVCHFFVLIGHHFLTKVYINSLFSSLHFFTPNQTKRKEIKIFSILPLFYPPIIFYPPTFSPFPLLREISIMGRGVNMMMKKEGLIVFLVFLPNSK